MHAVFALLCFVVVIHWLIFPCPSGLLHWHCDNLTIAPVPAKQPWWIWINTSCEFIMNDCITTAKQSTTKPCAYFVGYTVSLFYHQNRLWGTPGPQPTDNLPRKPGFHSRTQVPSRHCLPRQCGLWQSPRGSALWVWCPTRDRPCLWPQPDCRGGRGCWTWYQSSDEISWCVTWKGMCVCGIIDIITPCLHLQGVWAHNAYLQL